MELDLDQFALIAVLVARPTVAQDSPSII